MTNCHLDTKTVQTLTSALALHSSKKPHNRRSASLAISRSGQEYPAGGIETDTHVLDMTSEQNAIILSVLKKDYGVNKIITLREEPDLNAIVNPLTLKFIIDYQIRTGTPVEYIIIDTSGKILFQSKNLTSIFTHYNPASVPLKKITENTGPSSNTATFDSTSSITETLKKYALQGIERNFPQYDSASGYGTAILTKNGKIFFGGQYSNFDNRLGFHSEMTAIISSLMSREYEIRSLGLVSTKYPDSPCDACGVCRQFISEMASRYNWQDFKIYNFALETPDLKENPIDTYLQGQWSNKNKSGHNRCSN